MEERKIGIGTGLRARELSKYAHRETTGSMDQSEEIPKCPRCKIETMKETTTDGASMFKCARSGHTITGRRYKIGHRILVWDGASCWIIRTVTEEERTQTELRDRLFGAASIINELLDHPPETLPKLSNIPRDSGKRCRP